MHFMSTSNLSLNTWPLRFKNTESALLAKYVYAYNELFSSVYIVLIVLNRINTEKIYRFIVK